LIGRAAEVTHLCNRLLGHSGRLLTLVGPPGVGKTTLALAVAAQVQHYYRDGARFVPLAAVSDAGLMAATLVTTLAPGDASAKPPQSRLIELLRRQTILLLLDNLEQIDGAGSLIATLLAECPALTILATSRGRLHLRAEQRCKVPLLDLASAVELFVQHVQAIDAPIDLNEENRSTIAAICTKLDCLPLALELCAAQSELFTLAQLLQQLEANPLDLLAGGPHDLPSEQRTLRHALQRSYGMLDNSAQQLFHTLGLFAGGFDLNAVTYFGYSNAALQVLIHTSLVTDALHTPSIGNDRRFFLLETIRQFAFEQLVNASDAASVRHRFLAYFGRLVETAQSYQETPERKVWRDRLNQDLDNIRIALQIALEQNEIEFAARMVNHLYSFWYRLGLVEEGRRWVGRLLQQSAVVLTPRLYAATLATSAKLAVIQGDWRNALSQFQTSMKHYETARDEENYVNVSASYSEALLDIGEVQPAFASIQSCLDKAQSWPVTTKLCPILAHVYYVSARVLLRMDELAAARLQLEKSSYYCQQAEDRSSYALAIYSIAQLDMRQGFLVEARAKYAESLAVFLEYESHLLAASSYYFLGYLDRITECHENALYNFRDAITRFVHMSNVGSIVGTLTEIAKVAIVKEKYREACLLLGSADFLRKSIGETQWKALPAERAEYERYIELLHQHLDGNSFREAWEAGHATAVGDLLGYVTHFIAMLCV
jgi:predicted ATPase